MGHVGRLGQSRLRGRDGRRRLREDEHTTSTRSAWASPAIRAAVSSPIGSSVTPTGFAAAISGAGIANWISDYATSDIPRTKESEFFGAPWDRGRDILEKQSPITYAAHFKTPTLFVNGESDARVPIEEAEQMYTGAAQAAHPRPDGPLSGHATTAAGARGTPCTATTRSLKWWERYLGAAKNVRPAPPVMADGWMAEWLNSSG